MRQLAIHSNHVRCVAYSPDGKFLATASNDQSIRLIETASGKTVARWANQGAVMQAVAFSPDGKQLAFGGQQPILGLVDVESEAITTRQFPDAREVTMGGVTFLMGGRITALAYLPDGRTLVAGSGDRILRIQDGKLYVWTMAGTVHRNTFLIPGGVHHLALRPDGKQLALGTGLGWRYVDTSTWRIGNPQTQGPTAPAVAYSSDGAMLAVAQGHNILLQDVPTQQFLRLLRGHQAKITSLAFTPDGRRLLSGSWDRTARLWAPASGQEVGCYDWERGKVQYVAVAPDGMTAAAACDKGVVIWDLDD